MSRYKIKPPKKPRKPSAKFLARKAAETEAKHKALPDEGEVRLYLDDERNPPEGWTLVRSPTALRNMIDTLEPGRLTGLSLDWHLGAGLPNGEQVVEDILELMRVRAGQFQNLDMVHLHSSDREKAANMARRIAIPVREKWDGIPHYGVDISQPFKERY